MKALYAIGADPAFTEGNIAKVEEALKSLELLFVQDIFPNKTMEFAHVVLPAATFAEKDGTFVNTERHVQRIRKAIHPVGQSKPDWQILSELAERMDYTHMRYDHPEEISNEIRSLVPFYAGITYDRLEEQPGLQWPCPSEDHPGTPFLHAGGFSRGRALLKGTEYLAADENPDAEYPFLLTTGRLFMQYNSGTMSRRTRVWKTESENFVQINRADAVRLGINERDRVRISTRHGEIIVGAKISEINEGVIWIPFHQSENLTNRLTSDAFDPVCGITELKVCAAKLLKI